MASDTFKFGCPSCGQHIAVNRSDVGVHADCPACGRPLVVPRPFADSVSCGFAVTDGPCTHGMHHGLQIPHGRPPASRRLAFGVAAAVFAVLAFVTGAILFGTGGKIGRSPFQPSNPSAVLYVAVLDSGKLLADGQEVNFEQLRSQLAATRRDNGLVRLYLESTTGHDGGIQSRQVIDLIDKLFLPVTRPSPSESLDPYLKPHPKPAPLESKPPPAT